MAGLQRSAVSFRRQGSSGLVWNDKFLSGELTQSRKTEHKFYSGQLPRSRRHLNAGSGNVIDPEAEEIRIRPIRTSISTEDSRRLAVPSDPPSPKLTACGCCGRIAKAPRSSRNPRTR